MTDTTRRFSFSHPTRYKGQTYPTAEADIDYGDGTAQQGRIFADANGIYHTLDADGNILDATPVHGLDEVIVTAPRRDNLLSERFNDYLVKNKNDATYIEKPLVQEPIEPDLSFSAALRRSTKPYSNYSETLDNPFGKLTETLVNGARYVKDNYMDIMPTGASNCTLSATQWINPANPVKSASSIVNDPTKYNYARIDSADAVPGDLLIAKVPGKDSYHSMMIIGFADKDSKKDFRGKTYNVRKGEPLLTYSQGGNSLDNIQSNIPLSVYTKNSDGHTENIFFRHTKPRRGFTFNQ